ncbi:MAG: hypothetical protein KGK08_03075 [Acidobacteriota bacterium]|nr:hypothetical protein [Acidobacteriota bacterium]
MSDPQQAEDALAPGENPLVRHQTLEQMYRRLVELDALQCALAALQPDRAGRRNAATYAACRVGVLQGCTEQDVVLESVADGSTACLLGVKPAAVLRARAAELAGRRSRFAGSSQLLPWLPQNDARLQLSLGAAALLQRQGKGGVVVVYTDGPATSSATWTSVLRQAQALLLPILFVATPGARGWQPLQPEELCRLSRRCGVPGIPVDAHDAVALYRVAQESLMRLRSGGGPVLATAVPYRIQGKRSPQLEDPIQVLRSFMRVRNIRPDRWFEAIATQTQRQLQPKATR